MSSSSNEEKVMNGVESSNSNEEQARYLCQEITGSDFDMDQFDQLYPIFHPLLESSEERVKRLTKELNIAKKERDTIISFRDKSKEHMETYLKKMQSKFMALTSEEKPDDDREEDNIGLPPGLGSQDSINKSVYGTDFVDAATLNGGFLDEQNTKNDNEFSYLKIAQKGEKKSETSSTMKTVPSSNIVKQIYVTPDIGIQGIICSDPNQAPPGKLYWNPKKFKFGIRIVVGNSSINFEGNIGNIFVRSDTPTHVELCRRSRVGKPCIRQECTYRHEPPKEKEPRNWYSAEIYMPPWQASMAKDRKGVHRIGSREYLKGDLEMIRKPESRESRDAYIEQAFHFLLVALVIKSGVCLDKPINEYPAYMDAKTFRI